MSVQAIAWVLEHSASTGNERCVLIAIANHIGPDGEGWAYKDRVLAESGRMTEKVYRRHVNALIIRGELLRREHAGGQYDTHSRHRPNAWAIPALLSGDRRSDWAPQFVDAANLRTLAVQAEAMKGSQRTKWCSELRRLADSDPVDLTGSPPEIRPGSSDRVTCEGEAVTTTGSLSESDPVTITGREAVDLTASIGEPSVEPYGLHPPQVAQERDGSIEDDDDPESESDGDASVVAAVAEELARRDMARVDAHEGQPRQVPGAWLRRVRSDRIESDGAEIRRQLATAGGPVSIEQLADLVDPQSRQRTPERVEARPRHPSWRQEPPPEPDGPRADPDTVRELCATARERLAELGAGR